MNYWLAQSDPATFRLMDWLRDFPWIPDDNLVDWWHIDGYAEEIRQGDILWIWKREDGDAASGVYARAKVIPEPEEFPLKEKEGEYCLNEAELEKLETLPRIAVRYTRFYLGIPVLEEELKENPTLKDEPVIVNGYEMISRLSEKQGYIIEQMLRRKSTGFDPNECKK